MNKNELIVVKKSLPMIKKDDEEKLPMIPVSYEMVDPSHYRFDFVISDSISVNMFESDRIIDVDDFIDFESEDGFEKSMKPYVEIAAACGSLIGLIGTFIDSSKIDKIGDLTEKDWNNIIIKIANYIGYDKNDYKGAQKYIQSRIQKIDVKYKDMVGENISKFTGNLATHPTIAGLCFSILSQFYKKKIYMNKEGEIKKTSLPKHYKIGGDVNTKIVFGIIYWLYNICVNSFISANDILNNLSIDKALLKIIKNIIKKIDKKAFLDKLPTNIEDAEEKLSKWLDDTFNKSEEKDNSVIDQIYAFMNRFFKNSIWVFVNDAVTKVAYLAIKVNSLIETGKINAIADIQDLDIEVLFPKENKVLSRMYLVSSATFVGANIGACVVKGIKGKKVAGRGFAECILTEINIVGIGRFIYACVNDSKYWIEDIKLLFNKENKNNNAESDNSIDIETLLKEDSVKQFMLDPEHSRILFSLENKAILFDIENSIKDKKAHKEEIELKKEWHKKWTEKINETWVDVDKWGFITDEEYLYDTIYQTSKDTEKTFQMYLLVLELLAFEPYVPLGSENDKKYSKLKYSDKYIDDVFVRRQTVVSQEEVEKIRKKLDTYNGIISGSTQRIFAGVGAVLVVTALTAGAAYAFAPIIAPIIAGGAVEGLSGAALTSASLAFVGGGSIAAGGLGMAGGTAIITGGGALLGLASTGTVSSLAVLTNNQKSIWIDSGKKLLAYSSVYLIDIKHDKKTVKAIYLSIKKYAASQEKLLNSIIIEKNDLDDQYIKNYKDSIKCLDRIVNEFEKLI